MSASVCPVTDLWVSVCPNAYARIHSAFWAALVTFHGDVVANIAGVHA